MYKKILDIYNNYCFELKLT